jgi:hypothetical protein
MNKYYFLLVVHGDVEPELKRFVSEEKRDSYAKAHRRGDPGQDDGLYPMEIESPEIPRVSVDSYSNGFFEVEDNYEARSAIYYTCSECGTIMIEPDSS